jgi:hypothetical protein
MRASLSPEEQCKREETKAYRREQRFVMPQQRTVTDVWGNEVPMPSGGAEGAYRAVVHVLMDYGLTKVPLDLITSLAGMIFYAQCMTPPRQRKRKKRSK